jgi:hypothetical protein
VAVLVLYFLHFALPSLAGGFNEDEMTGMYAYWRPGALKLLWANICFWKGFGRPAGALYYLSLYHFFALNPQPYRVVQVSILAALIPMLYYLARLLASTGALRLGFGVPDNERVNLLKLLFRTGGMAKRESLPSMG